MGDYLIRIKPKAEKEIERLNTDIIQRLFPKLESLAENPRPSGCKNLKGFSDLWRIRTGDYRVIYTIDDKSHTIDILRIAHRREVYD